MACGVYQIENVMNGKKYIGSSRNIKLRWNKHKVGLKSGKHANLHLQAAYNKYGCDAFKYSIIELCPFENLEYTEQKFINLYGLSKLYNKRQLANTNIGVNSGEANYQTKLKNADVIKIKILLLKNKKTMKEIAEQFDVLESAISDIRQLRSWVNIGKEYNEALSKMVRSKRPNNKLSDKEVINIKKMLCENKNTQKEIAVKFDISVSTISGIKHLNSWKDIGEEYNDALSKL